MLLSKLSTWICRTIPWKYCKIRAIFVLLRWCFLTIFGWYVDKFSLSININVRQRCRGFGKNTSRKWLRLWEHMISCRTLSNTLVYRFSENYEEMPRTKEKLVEFIWNLLCISSYTSNHATCTLCARNLSIRITWGGDQVHLSRWDFPPFDRELGSLPHVTARGNLEHWKFLFPPLVLSLFVHRCTTYKP